MFFYTSIRAHGEFRVFQTLNLKSAPQRSGVHFVIVVCGIWGGLTAACAPSGYSLIFDIISRVASKAVILAYTVASYTGGSYMVVPCTYARIYGRHRIRLPSYTGDSYTVNRIRRRRLRIPIKYVLDNIIIKFKSKLQSTQKK